MIMFSNRSLLALLICCALVGPVSGTSELPPILLRDIGKAPQRRVRLIRFEDYSKIGVEHSIPCSIQFVDRFFGYLNDEAYYQRNKMPLQSACYEANRPEIMGDAPVRFDSVRNEWVRDIGVALKRWGSGEELRPEEVKAISESIHVYPLNTVNSRGFAYTEDDWTGDERGRRRHLEYCLFREQTALCGSEDMNNLSDGVEMDLTTYTLEILRSMEFLPNTHGDKHSPHDKTDPAPMKN